MTPRIVLNAFLLLALAISVALSWALSPNPAKPNFEFLPQMAHSPRYNAFSANPNFENGATLQTPVSGTIPRGLSPLHYAATPEDAMRAGAELKSPVQSGNLQARQRGEFVFANFCAVCHGPGGAGNGPVTQRGFPPPPSLLAEHAAKMQDGQLFHILTYGQNNMPSYASQVSRDDRWNVILYVRALQAAAPITQPALEKGSQARGVAAGGQP